MSAVPISGLAQAQMPELEPLPQILEETAQVDLLTRCSALFLSTVKWVGETRLGAENSQNFQTATVRFLEAAIIAQSELDGIEPDPQEIEQVRDGVVASAQSITEQYLERYRALMETGRISIEQDGLWNADMDTCAVIASGSNDG